MRRSLLILATLTWLACGDDTTTTVARVTDVPFTTLLHGDIGVGVFDSGVLAINSDEAADNALDYIHPAFVPRSVVSALTNVDYSRHTVIVVSSGRRSGTGYELTVENMTSDGAVLTLHIFESAWNLGGPRVDSYPTHIVRISKTDLPVAMSVEHECNGEPGPGSCY